MELNKLKIELIRKLMNANLSAEEKQEIFAKAKEIIERDKSTDCKLPK
jgi:hypothetical protein